MQLFNQQMLEEFSDVNELWLLIGIPNRDPFFVTQYLNRHCEFRSAHEELDGNFFEVLHVMMQCYMRQHFADRCWLHEHPRGHAPWREFTMRKFETITPYFVKGLASRWNVQKMRSASSEYVRKATGFFTNSWGRSK